MQTFTCKKCNSTDLFIKESGTQTGLYCGNCGVWQKWLGKEEKRLIEGFIEERNKLLEEPKYSFEYIKQIIFDCMMELQYGTEGLSKEHIVAKLYDALKELDKINIKQ